ncbi:uncharacterized protein LOC108887018 isoform X2 [Lates calcarifer]|uniref:Uncharacterized protein LOC108887018 isoform X2 n=1 Tax=Lates calcarifer TaxID=8187 RepID=A0AAJ8DRQ3_LATCA|nr:uncharacterized protein LOC108887018 isoform X2 [Lates calcarifer]
MLLLCFFFFSLFIDENRETSSCRFRVTHVRSFRVRPMGPEAPSAQSTGLHLHTRGVSLTGVMGSHRGGVQVPYSEDYSTLVCAVLMLSEVRPSGKYRRRRTERSGLSRSESGEESGCSPAERETRRLSESRERGQRPREVTVRPGEDVTLQCQGPRDSTITLLEWIRPDLKSDGYVFFYRNDRPYENYQHPSFRGRVKLRDKSLLKDGDMSVILKNVTDQDSGAYECRIISSAMEGNERTYKEVRDLINLTVTHSGQLVESRLR